MRSFEAPAIENIATAPATGLEKRAAVVVTAVLVVLFAAALPFERVGLADVPALVPTAVGAELLALVLTTMLLFVQYRLARDVKLALLGLAYAVATATQFLYLVTFPGFFAPNGVLGVGSQAAPWCYLASQLGFGGFLIAEGVAARRGWQMTGTAVRLVTAGTVVALAGFALVVLGAHRALPVVFAHDAYTAGWRAFAIPLALLVQAAALVVASGRLRTVTEVWLSIVVVARMLSLLATVLSSGRFAFGWYAGRIAELVASIVVLGVFFVKINDVMLHLAARSRTTAEALAFGEARYGALANVVPQLIWTTDPVGGIEFVNDRWTAYTGYDLAGTRDGGWRSAIHPDQQQQIRDRWDRALRTGEPFAAEYRLREGTTGRYRWFLVNAVSVRDRRGTIQSWIGTCTDVDAQKRLEEREAFLARAGERLGASLDVVATVAGIKSLVVPRLAERAWVALLDDDGRFMLSGIASTELADELDTRRWIGAPLATPVQEALAGIVERADPVVLDKPDRFPDPWVRSLAAGAAMIVPLLSGETRIGALALTRTSGRAYDADDAGLVREFARRAALSLEHARLYERERTTADALQRAMLPAALPQLADIKFSECYSAASESQRVGGDFYDAFELPDGRVAVAIGDVTGHGLEAAVVMGEIRQAIRAAAFEAAEPSAILDRASRLLVLSGRSVFVTAIFGILDPGSGRFAYATAGHPPALLLDGDGIHRLPASGLPLGLRDDDGVDFALRLHAPCTLVLYTDGLLEFGRDLEDGERRIEDGVRRCAADGTEQLANALMKDVLREDQATDDIAILAVRIARFPGASAGDEREWRFPSGDAHTGAAVRREIGALASRWSGREEARFVSELAFGELLGNVVRHAPGAVRAILTRDAADDVRLVVEDAGIGFGAPAQTAVDPLAESGRGLAIVGAVTDGLAIENTTRGGVRATVSFRGARALAGVG